MNLLRETNKLGSPKFDPDEVLHLDSKLISSSMKHNDLVTKFLLQVQELDNLRHSDTAHKQEIHSLHNQLIQANARI